MRRDRTGGIVLGESGQTPADREALAELAREDRANEEAYAYYAQGMLWIPRALGDADLRLSGGRGYFDPQFWEQDSHGRLRRRRP